MASKDFHVVAETDHARPATLLVQTASEKFVQISLLSTKVNQVNPNQSWVL